MIPRVLRNDDVAADTSLHEIRTFCEMCDAYGITPMHAITPIGDVRGVDCRWDNRRIRSMTATRLFSENTEVVEYLRRRRGDLYAVHGLWHTHEPADCEIEAAWHLIAGSGFLASYFVPPFNEFRQVERVTALGLKVSGKECPRIEDYLDRGDPEAEMVYTHSWRYEFGPWTWKQLDACLQRLSITSLSNAATPR